MKRNTCRAIDEQAVLGVKSRSLQRETVSEVDRAYFHGVGLGALYVTSLSASNCPPCTVWSSWGPTTWKEEPGARPPVEEDDAVPRDAALPAAAGLPPPPPPTPNNVSLSSEAIKLCLSPVLFELELHPLLVLKVESLDTLAGGTTSSSSSSDSSDSLSDSSDPSLR